jgi:hypothetical protein
MDKTTRSSGQDLEHEAGNDLPRWFGMDLERRYSRLGPRDWSMGLPSVEQALTGTPRTGLFVPGPGEAALAELPKTYWKDVKNAAAERRRAARGPFVARGVGPTGAGVPGSNNWIPIGPSVVRRGQASGNPPISGRTVGIAIASGGNRVYVATADGGVWRSDDAGASWRSTMDGFDIDPTAFAATSNACGAIAIDPADPDRIYVGTGEAETYSLFSSRVISALPTYRGVGAIRSDTGGSSWVSEPTAAGSPTLAGEAFFALAIDPGDRENVVAATTAGLYRREPDGAGGYRWALKRAGVHCSVVACAIGGVTTFYAAAWGGSVWSSPDGNTWTAIGTPSAAAGRVTLAARQTDPSVLYAVVAVGNTFSGLYRLDGGGGTWRLVGGGLPSLGGQASYNLPLAVDPNDASTVYLAGSAFAGNGSIFRCAITSPSAGTYTMTSTFIGNGVHADVHALTHAPGDSSTLWTGCDGGVFRTTAATAAATFQHRNTGLATLCADFFSQDPIQPAVILVGLQDNGTARYTGEECWTHVYDGDGGYTLINWANPNKVLAYVNGRVVSASDGGQSTASFSTVLSPPWVVMAEPLASTPYRPASPADADTVAFGAGTNLYISTNFGVAWGAPISLSQNIFALAFASPTRLYVATVLGQVHRFDKPGATWTDTRIDNAAGGPLSLSGVITDIEVDPADASGSSIYVTFAGNGDYRHVWHFDGTAWQSRSGPALGGLLDVEHNAIVADPTSPSTLFVASDVGISKSTDAGATWAPMENGLPDSAVLDLQLHPTARLLRACTHGRGLFEFKLDLPAQPDVEIYARDTSLDVARGATADGLLDPETWPATPVVHYLSRNIKVDVPTPAGYQTPSSNIDFLTFNDTIVDGSQHTATLDPATGTVTNRVYVEVHNRGLVDAASVQVMLLVTTPSVALAPLPVGYQANVLAGTPISSLAWQTVGIRTLTNLHAGFPQIAAFALPSTMLPPPASLPASQHHCLAALLHSPGQDAYTSTQTNVDILTVSDRKVVQRNLQVIAFAGTPPPPGTGTWAQIDLYGSAQREGVKELLLDLRGFKGRLAFLLPDDLTIREPGHLEEFKRSITDRWAHEQTGRLKAFIQHGRFNHRLCERMLVDIERLARRPLLGTPQGSGSHLLSGVQLKAGARYPIFLYIEPQDLKGAPQTFSLIQRDQATKRLEGGSTYRIVTAARQSN